MNLPIQVKLLRQGAIIPVRGSDNAAGWDVHALLPNTLDLEPGQSLVIPTGLAMAVPDGYCYLVCCRSGLAFRDSVIVPHAPGIIDADYRGELMILLKNTGKDLFFVHSGDRIAQLVFTKHEVPEFTVVQELPPTRRGGGGFGSSGRQGLVVG